MSTSQEDQPLSRRELRERAQARSAGGSTSRRVSTGGPIPGGEPAPVTAPLNTAELRALAEAERSGAPLTRRQVRDLERARLGGGLPELAEPGAPVPSPRVGDDTSAEALAAVTGAIARSGIKRDRQAEAEANAAAIRAEVERADAERRAVAEQAATERAAAEAAEAERAQSKRAKKKSGRKGAAEKAAAEQAAEREQRAEAERKAAEKAQAAVKTEAAEKAEAAERKIAADRVAAEERAAAEKAAVDAAAARAVADIRPSQPSGNVDETRAMARGAAFGPAATESESESAPRLAQGFGVNVASNPVPSAGFDDILARGVDTTGGSSTTTNALILPSLPGSGPLTGPLLGTGEVIVTGTIDLPGSLSNTGQHPNRYEKGELDTMFDHDEDPQPATAGNPVSASRAVSSHTATRDVIAPPAPAKNNRLLMILSITAGVLTVAVVGVVIVALLSGSIGAGQ